MIIGHNKTTNRFEIIFDMDFDFSPENRDMLKGMFFHFDPKIKAWGRAFNYFIDRILRPELYSIKHIDKTKIKVPPYAFQQKVLDILLSDHNKRGLFLEMGLGKTKITIDYWNIKDMNSVLVVCPKTVISSWETEIKKFSYNYYKIFIGKDTTKKKRQRLKEFKAHTGKKVFITNYETVKVTEINNHTFDLLVFDESSKLKNGNTKRTKAAFKMQTRDVLLLTGTPYTNSPKDLMNQFRFIAPHQFGLSEYKFKTIWCNLDYFKNIINVIDRKRAKFNAIKNQHSIIIKKKDVLEDLPDKIYETRTVEMHKDLYKEYITLQKAKFLELKEGTITPQTALTKTLRLRELAGGFYREDGEVLKIGCKHKLTELKNLIEDELQKPVIIYYNFNPEKQMILETIDNCITLEEYEAEGLPEDNTRHLVLNASQGYGLNLQDHYDTIIYYSQLYSREHRLQSEDRIWRIGTKHSPIIIDLLYQNTIEEHIYKYRGDIIKTINEMIITNLEEEG